MNSITILISLILVITGSVTQAAEAQVETHKIRKRVHLYAPPNIIAQQNQTTEDEGKDSEYHYVRPLEQKTLIAFLNENSEFYSVGVISLLAHSSGINDVINKFEMAGRYKVADRIKDYALALQENYNLDTMKPEMYWSGLKVLLLSFAFNGPETKRAGEIELKNNLFDVGEEFKYIWREVKSHSTPNYYENFLLALYANLNVADLTEEANLKIWNITKKLTATNRLQMSYNLFLDVTPLTKLGIIASAILAGGYYIANAKLGITPGELFSQGSMPLATMLPVGLFWYSFRKYEIPRQMHHRFMDIFTVKQRETIRNLRNKIVNIVKNPNAKKSCSSEL